MTSSRKFAAAGGGAGTSGLSRHKCLLIGWVIGWASFTYASATVRVFQGEGSLAGADVLAAVFQVADDVPPYAKISFGLVFLLNLLLAARWLPEHGGATSAGSAMRGASAAVVAAGLVLGAAPFNYFTGPGVSFAASQGVAVAPHLVAAAAAGIVYAVFSLRCSRRGVAP